MTIPNSYVNIFFPGTTGPRKSLAAECFLLAYHLNGFKPRVNWQHLSSVSFQITYLYTVHLSPFWRRIQVILVGSMIFLSAFLDATVLLRTARFEKLPAECISLT